MKQLIPSSIASALLQAPGWARLGLGVRDERLRERAADVIAARIITDLSDDPVPDPRQIALPL